MGVIFSTIHGSRLYGLATPQSDTDIYLVTTSRKAKVKHTVREDEPGRVVDMNEVGIDHLLDLANRGSHQAVEAIFSQRKVWVDRGWEAHLNNVRIGGPEVYERYERTIKSFCFGDFKRRRHACRLALNLRDLRDEGRFNPELTSIEIGLVNGYARAARGDELVKALI